MKASKNLEINQVFVFENLVHTSSNIVRGLGKHVLQVFASECFARSADLCLRQSGDLIQGAGITEVFQEIYCQLILDRS